MSHMPAQKTTRKRDRRTNDPGYESRIQDALAGVRSRQFKSFREAGMNLNVSVNLLEHERQIPNANNQIPASTLTDRAKGPHTPFKDANRCRQLLTINEEQNLVHWVEHRSTMGLPFSAEDLRISAAVISGKDVGRRWHKKFLKRNPQVSAMKPAKLDPKRAKIFNEAVINDYFDKLERASS